MSGGTRQLHGEDAELLALQMGVRDELIRRAEGKLPTIKGNVLTRMAIVDGAFVVLSKDSDGNIKWFGLKGPNARAAGAEMVSGMWDTHQGPLETRTLEWDPRQPPNS